MGHGTHPRRKGEVLTVGSRVQVWRGHAKKTSGGLRKKDLMKNREGRIVSRKMHRRAKRRDNPLSEWIAEAKRGDGPFGKKKGRKRRSRK
jgi:hypothetical protein